VKAFRTRPLGAGPYSPVWLDDLAIKVREAAWTVNVHALGRTGLTVDSDHIAVDSGVGGWPGRYGRGG
jgi:transposase-like protein